MAQHFFHGLDIETLTGNFRRRFIFRQDLREASHFTLCFQDGLGLIRTRFFQNTLRLTISTWLNFVGVGFCFTDVLLFVFTCSNRIVKGRFHLFRRTCSLEVDVQQGNPHVVWTNGLFQLTLGIATDNGTTFGQDTVHGVFTDHPAQGAVGRLAQAVISAGHAKQITLRIGHAVLHVHLNAHHVFVRRQHHTRRRQFTDRFHVDRGHVVNEGRFPVQARLNQMAELAKTRNDTAFRFFNGVEPGSSPDDYHCSGNNTDYAATHLRARPLGGIST